MNPVVKAIESGISVREFTKEFVSRELVLKLLNLSTRAPSDANAHLT
jgi:nitroreductase